MRRLVVCFEWSTIRPSQICFKLPVPSNALGPADSFTPQLVDGGNRLLDVRIVALIKRLRQKLVRVMVVSPDRDGLPSASGTW